MIPQRNAAVAAALMAVLAGWDVAWLVASGSARVETTGAVPIPEHQASSPTADAGHADAPQATAMGNAAIDQADAARTAEAVNGTTTETTAGSDEKQSIAVVSSTDVSQTPPPKTSAVPAAAASTPAGSGSAGAEDAGATPSPERPASSLTADTEHADAPQATAAENAAPDAAVDKTEAAKTAEAVTGTVTGKATGPDELGIAESGPADASQTPPAEAPPVQVATASMPEATASAPDLRLNDAGRDSGSVEIVDECLVLEICVDRYLWGLYQRAPKEDSIKVQEQRQVTVKRKGKTRTVTQTFSRLLDEDFAWKDPKAAEKVGMPMMDYVIGGMDQGFKLKLFQTLHAAEEAGLSPGITSAFRDDYRQSLASGLKAATDRSYHGGSFRGGYGHGLAADVVSVKGGTRDERWASSEILWKWIDEHGKELGIGRPYLDRDPAHMAPIDGQEYADHHRGTNTQQTASNIRKHHRLAVRDDHNAAKRRSTARSSKVRTI